MTTYAFTGFAFDMDAQTGANTGIISGIEFELIGPDNSGFTYSLVSAAGTSGAAGTAGPDDDLPAVEIEDNLYSVMVAGEHPENWDGIVSIGEIYWNGNTSVVLVAEQEIDSNTTRNYVLQLGGDPLPSLSTLQDLEDLDNAITGTGVATGAFAPGETILWQDLPNGTATEHDDIVGSGHRERFFGGKGNDTISGEGNNDKLIGGAGKDKLFGDGGHDTLNGGGGRDRLDGGKGEDLLDGGKGNDILKGAAGADTFVFAGNFGNDRIIGFNANSDDEKIDLSRVNAIESMDDLENGHMQQDGSNVVIDDGNGNTIELRNVLLADLDAGDFIF
ncbi:MAG: calcium-binding protein [Leisingera sp.]